MAGAGVELPGPAGHLDLLAHAGQAEMVQPELATERVHAAGGDKAGAVIAYLELHLVAGGVQCHPGMACPGMLGHVARASWAIRYSTVSGAGVSRTGRSALTVQATPAWRWIGP